MAWIGRLRNLFNRGKLDRRIDEELSFHIAERIDELVAGGLNEREARRQAGIQFGGYNRHREAVREIDLSSKLESTLGDIRFGIRKFAASPAFALAAILSLALGTGANLSIFGIINALMLRSLPVADPARLVEVGSKEVGDTFSNPIWEQVRDGQRPFAGMTAWSADRFDLARGGVSRFASGLRVSGDFFHVLGVPPLQGRVFTAEEDRRGTAPLAVISYAFWKRNFPNQSHVLGKTIYLKRHAFEVIGVTPPWFTGLDVDKSFDVAIPIACDPVLRSDGSALENGSFWWLQILGRLPRNIDIRQAEAQLRTRAPAVYRAAVDPHWKAEDQKEFFKSSFRLSPANVGFSQVRDRYRTALFTLMGTAGLVLLITCANLANLLLARSSARQREIALRLALGASRMRVVRQLLIEGLLLSAAGTAAGFVLSLAGSRLLVRLISTARDPVSVDLSLDLHLLGFASVTAVLTTLLFALAPAFRATRGNLNPALKENARGAVEGSSRFRLGKALIAGQVALSLILLVAAGLFLGTLKNLLSIDLGFNKQGVLLVNAEFQENAVEKARRLPIGNEILRRLRSIPGVVSASSSMRTPISDRGWDQFARPEGYRAKSRLDTLMWMNRVSPGYFATMNTPLISGRDFTESDSRTAPKVMIIGESTARRFFGFSNPLGKTIAMDGPSGADAQDVYQVVGVVKDAKYQHIDEENRISAFVPSGQDPDPNSTFNFEVRRRELAGPLSNDVRTAIESVSPNVVIELRDLESQVNESVLQPRMVALLSGIFALLALILSAIGLYGVTAYSVSRRRNEIGIRMALGAGRASVIRLALEDVGILLVTGLIAGLAGSLALGHFIGSLLYGVRANDPRQMATAVVVLAMCASLAAFVPAWRAAGLDPLAALREE